MIECTEALPVRIGKRLCEIYSRQPGAAITLPGLPPSVNHLYTQKRPGVSKRAYQAKAKAWIDTALWEIRRQYRPGNPLPKNKNGRLYGLIIFHVREIRKWDMDNRKKALMDILVKRGVIQDDSIKFNQNTDTDVDIDGTITENYTEIFFWEVTPGS